MFGFFVGALSVLGILTLARGLRYAFWAGRYGHRQGACARYPGGFARHRGGHGRGRGDEGGDDEDGPRRQRHPGERFASDAGFARAMNEVVKRRLRIDDEQEDIVDHALGDLQRALAELRTLHTSSRPDLAAAFRGEQVDEAALASLQARQDEGLKQARKEVTSAMKQIHAVLRPDQRERAADWLAGVETR